MPKAASTLAAAPSTPPASISKTPVAVHECSVPTTSSPSGNQYAMKVDKWPQRTEFRSWKISCTSEVPHSSKYPRTAMLWIGEVEDAKSIDELITSA